MHTTSSQLLLACGLHAEHGYLLLALLRPATVLTMNAILKRRALVTSCLCY